jgi:hypothetical protein
LPVCDTLEARIIQKRSTLGHHTTIAAGRAIFSGAPGRGKSRGREGERWPCGFLNDIRDDSRKLKHG